MKSVTETIFETEPLQPDGETTDAAAQPGTQGTTAEEPGTQDGAAQQKEPLLVSKSAAEWLAEGATLPPKKQLFGTIWHEGELCILFGETGAAKSILAVQIGDALTKGISALDMENELPVAPVLYFDFELSTAQFYDRYSNGGFGAYNFARQFRRICINPNSNPDNFERELLEAVEQAAVSTGAKVLIIDNLTYFSHELEKARNALPFVIALKSIKEKHGLSVMIIGHTPKRDTSRELSLNDLGGSRMLANFVDCIFAIGKSTQDKSRRYIKQVKARQNVESYDRNNVLCANIIKAGGFTHFEFVGFSEEREHLTNERAGGGRPSKIVEMEASVIFGNDTLLTTADIAERAKKIYAASKTTAERWTKEALVKEEITQFGRGSYAFRQNPSVKTNKDGNNLTEGEKPLW